MWLSCFNRNLLNDALIQLCEEGILARSVMNNSSIPKAEMQRCCALNPLQRSVDNLYPVRSGLLGSRLQIRFINLYHVGPCGLQTSDLLVDCGSYIQCQGFLIAVIVILRLLGNRKGPRYSD